MPETLRKLSELSHVGLLHCQSFLLRTMWHCPKVTIRVNSRCLKLVHALTSSVRNHPRLGQSRWRLSEQLVFSIHGGNRQPTPLLPFCARMEPSDCRLGHDTGMGSQQSLETRLPSFARSQ